MSSRRSETVFKEPCPRCGHTFRSQCEPLIRAELVAEIVEVLREGELGASADPAAWGAWQGAAELIERDFGAES